MKTLYEVIWSIVGLILISWFIANFVYTCDRAAAPPSPALYQKGDGTYDTYPSSRQKQSIEQFLNDHPDIKKRVDELNRQADAEQRYKRS